jgi:hypothetical protein
MSGAFGRKTSKRATRALDAAEQLDAAALSARWDTLRRRQDESASGSYEPGPVKLLASAGNSTTR